MIWSVKVYNLHLKSHGSRGRVEQIFKGKQRRVDILCGQKANQRKSKSQLLQCGTVESGHTHADIP